MNTFASDNFSAVDPQVMAYLTKINQQGHAPSYQGDAVTRQAEAEFERVFGPGTRVIFVPSGTGANILSLKLLLSRPYEAVLASEGSHIYGEETGAVAANLGAHIYTLPHHDGKISLDELRQAVKVWVGESFHAPLPRVVSFANSTEYGTLYTPQEVRAIADYCHGNGLYVHMDGCRLPNVAATLKVSLRELSHDAGVDVLSFGGAKNGLMSAEAVVIFNAPEADTMRLQKQAMQLVSKQRFVSGQFIPYLAQERWRHNATTANHLAQYLARGPHQVLGDVITRPVVTNQVFCRLPANIIKRIRAAGHTIYDWPTGEVRFVTSWDNTHAEVDELLTLIQ